MIEPCSASRLLRRSRPLVVGLALLGASQGVFAQSCTVALDGTLVFPTVVALASGGNQTTDSGQSLKVGCDAGVAGPLKLFSATPRVMSNNANALPFNLSLNSGAVSDDLPANSPGAPFNVVRDGQGHAVTLYARILAQNFKSLPGGTYSAAITLTLEY